MTSVIQTNKQLPSKLPNGNFKVKPCENHQGKTIPTTDQLPATLIYFCAAGKRIGVSVSVMHLPVFASFVLLIVVGQTLGKVDRLQPKVVDPVLP
jgi:hypothetical protein